MCRVTKTLVKNSIKTHLKSFRISVKIIFEKVHNGHQLENYKIFR